MNRQIFKSEFWQDYHKFDSDDLDNLIIIIIYDNLI